MVLETERYPGGYQQQTYSTYQGSNDGYTSYQGVTEYTSPYSGYPRISTYPSSHAPHNQSSWSTGGDYHLSGANHYPGGGVVTAVKPTTGGYGSSCYENSYTYGSQHSHENPNYQGHGSPHGKVHGSPHHQGHGSPHGHGYESPPHHQSHGKPFGQGHGSPPQLQGQGNPYGYGNSNGFGSGIKTQINKLTHGHNTYGSGSPNYGHSPNGVNHGYEKPSWILKGLDDDE